MNKFTKLGVVLGAAGMLLIPALSYAQTSESAVTSTIGYFYSASGQMIDAEDNTGAMSSYLTRGERYDGTSETFAVSNIKDITADLDSNANVLNKYTYTAYGTQTSYPSTSNIQNQTLSINENPFTYSDYYTDGESGNYYLNARYYDPTLGIFITSDSYNLPNRYMYVNGNPVMGTDPTGHWWKLTGTFRWGTWGENEMDKPEGFENWRNNRSWCQSTSKEAYASFNIKKSLHANLLNKSQEGLYANLLSKSQEINQKQDSFLSASFGPYNKSQFSDQQSIKEKSNNNSFIQQNIIQPIQEGIIKPIKKYISRSRSNSFVKAEVPNNLSFIGNIKDGVNIDNLKKSFGFKQNKSNNDQIVIQEEYSQMDYSNYIQNITDWQYEKNPKPKNGQNQNCNMGCGFFNLFKKKSSKSEL